MSNLKKDNTGFNEGFSLGSSLFMGGMLFLIVGQMSMMLMMLASQVQDGSEKKLQPLISALSPFIFGLVIIVFGKFDLSISNVNDFFVNKKLHNKIPFEKLKIMSKLAVCIGGGGFSLGVLFLVGAIFALLKNI